LAACVVAFVFPAFDDELELECCVELPPAETFAAL
jgi:hypothetical protein